MSSTEQRCNPRFPTAGVLLDNSALVRLLKCDALDVLRGTVALHVARHVAKEFGRQGPTERAAYERLSIEEHRVGPGLPVWEVFGRIRGGKLSTRDLGEAESIAVAVAEAEEGRLLPFVTYDNPATKLGDLHGVVTLDFLDTLAWLVGCGAITVERADEIEALASVEDGWKRPAGYAGNIESVRLTRQQAVNTRVEVWRRAR